MKTLKEVEQIIREQKPYLKERFGLIGIQIFGSYSRQEQTDSSDLDLIIELQKPIGFAFIDLCDYFESIFQIKVDVLTSKSIKPSFMKFIQGDLINV